MAFWHSLYAGSHLLYDGQTPFVCSPVIQLVDLSLQIQTHASKVAGLSALFGIDILEKIGEDRFRSCFCHHLQQFCQPVRNHEIIADIHRLEDDFRDQFFYFAVRFRMREQSPFGT
jgi:hypothetical protein